MKKLLPLLIAGLISSVHSVSQPIGIAPHKLTLDNEPHSFYSADDEDDVEFEDFSIGDLVGSIDGLNASGVDEDILENETPGNPLDPEDFAAVKDAAIDDLFLDEEVLLEQGDPIMMARAFEGDILNVKTDDLMEQMSPSNALVRNAIKESYRKWPNGVVPYVISREYNRFERGVIAKAMGEYHDKTCIK